MAKKRMEYGDIMKVAETCGVDKNAFFVSAAKRYAMQVEAIEKIRTKIDEDGLMIAHCNVRGEINMDVNPLTVQLPKYIDTANKTLSLMLEIILKLGKQPTDSDGLGDFKL